MSPTPPFPDPDESIWAASDLLDGLADGADPSRGPAEQADLAGRVPIGCTASPRPSARRCDNQRHVCVMSRSPRPWLEGRRRSPAPWLRPAPFY